jgi:hypothetical protein
MFFSLCTFYKIDIIDILQSISNNHELINYFFLQGTDLYSFLILHGTFYILIWN